MNDKTQEQVLQAFEVCFYMDANGNSKVSVKCKAKTMRFQRSDLVAYAKTKNDAFLAQVAGGKLQTALDMPHYNFMVGRLANGNYVLVQY